MEGREGRRERVRERGRERPDGVREEEEWWCGREGGKEGEGEGEGEGATRWGEGGGGVVVWKGRREGGRG